MSLCKSIATVSMAYLDDELAAEERHELEAHLTECASCRAHLEADRADQDLIRHALVAPPAPELIRARLARSLDAADQAHGRAQRRRWSQYLLPGSAVLAAAAAPAVFVGVQAPSERAASTVAHEAVRHGTRSLPLEVQGASTGPWLRQHFEPSIEPPRFSEPGSTLIGARLLPRGINGKDGALLSYQVERAGSPFVLSVLVVRDVGDADLQDGRIVRINNRTLRVTESSGRPVVTYVDGSRMGYMFLAPELSVNELVWLVSRTELVGPQ
jgi:anti-sigma factor RsiW